MFETDVISGLPIVRRSISACHYPRISFRTECNPYFPHIGGAGSSNAIDSKNFQPYITSSSTATYCRSTSAIPPRRISLGGFMSPIYLFIAAIATSIALIVVVALVVWRRHAKPTPLITPPTGFAATSLTAPPSRYAADDEWESLAPYPDYALHAIPTSERVSQHAPPRETRYRSHSLTFDDVEPFEPDESFSFHSPEQRSAADTDFFSYAPPNARDVATSAPGDAAQRCPHCNSPRVDTLNIGRKAGSTIGSVAGATSGMAMAFSGAEAGAAVGAIGGPLGSVFGGLAGAVIAGLLGSAAGCAAGSAVGAAIDENVLDNYRCMSCGHTFSAQPD